MKNVINEKIFLLEEFYGGLQFYDVLLLVCLYKHAVFLLDFLYHL